MSHFYASAKGSRGANTRCGSKSSGMVAHASSWDDGVRVNIYHSEGYDYFEVYRTSGSRSGGGADKLIKKWRTKTD